MKRLRRHICAAQVEVEIAAPWSAKEVFQYIVKYDFNESLPNICQVLQYFLTVCVSVATCERSFSKLRLIKKYLRSTMLQERLTSLAILSIERKVANSIDFDSVIDKFASLKARKIKL